jgi:hypothetical protein
MTRQMSQLGQSSRATVAFRRRLALLLLAALATSVGLFPAAAQTKKQPLANVPADHAARMAKGVEVFRKHVRPVLESKCLRCHGGKGIESEFDLSDRDTLLKGGLAGPAVIPGKSKDSLLIKLITHAREPHMPHNSGKLPADVIAHIGQWIDLGAPYDAPLAKSKAKSLSWTEKVLPASAKKFWSLEPLTRPAPPSVKNEGWCKTPIDRFILAKLEAARLSPSPPAGKPVLLRRAYFDVLGLPPTPEEAHAFLNDSAPDAYDKLIDRLLNSPHFGERWARHWLDLARFAESHGFEHDYDRPSAYHYRDFVIKAFNRDLPYDTFVKWQIAGDEFAPDDPLALTATGFLAAGVHSTQITKNEVEKHRYDEMDDKLNTLSTAFLGLTVGCARCHDHKYDPIPQRDYYRMLSTFTTTVRSEVEVNFDPESFAKAQGAFKGEHARQVAALQRYEAKQPPTALAALASLARNPVQAALVGATHRTFDPEWRKLAKAVGDHSKKAPKLPKALIASEGLAAVRLHTQGEDFFNETYFLRRGETEQKEGVATPSYLQVLMPSPQSDRRWWIDPPKGSRTSYRRRALAEWLTDVDHGAGRLLARVIVNRLWQHYLGQGLVATPSDFGARGERPVHPDLLDWLATELIQNGWRLKHVHKLILQSAVYRQTSQVDESKAKLDRDNKLYWRNPARRLEAEVIRDNLLAVSGELDRKLFGPGTLDEASKRRSIYFTVKRSKLMPMMTIFDAPDALGGLADRPTTTIAPQALYLMNNAQARGYAKSFARRIDTDGKRSLEDAVRSGYLIALARPPERDELADSVAFVRQQMATYPEAERRQLALADFCQVLMCLNEFIYVE